MTYEIDQFLSLKHFEVLLHITIYHANDKKICTRHCVESTMETLLSIDVNELLQPHTQEHNIPNYLLIRG
jgi:hypothetical protein